MPIGPQPKRARGTIGRPYSALNLRLWLAIFGLVACTLLAVLAFWVGLEPLGYLLVLGAVIAVVDIVVVQLRRRARRRVDPQDHSLFE
jgi:membrane protein implicated in regulation of membrane protease activity